jgi:hypothetical protein
MLSPFGTETTSAVILRGLPVRAPSVELEGMGYRPVSSGVDRCRSALFRREEIVSNQWQPTAPAIGADFHGIEAGRSRGRGGVGA